LKVSKYTHKGVETVTRGLDTLFLFAI